MEVLYKLYTSNGIILYTVYCKSFEVEKFRGFRGLTGDRETFPVKDFPTGNFLKNDRRHYTGERGIAIPIQLHECWIQLLWATINNVSFVECNDACHIACCVISCDTILQLR